MVDDESGSSGSGSSAYSTKTREPQLLDKVPELVEARRGDDVVVAVTGRGSGEHVHEQQMMGMAAWRWENRWSEARASS